jgi:hypothetical protein
MRQGNPKCSKTNLPQCHSVNHESHMNIPGLNSGFRGEYPAIKGLSYGTAIPVVVVL